MTNDTQRYVSKMIAAIIVLLIRVIGVFYIWNYFLPPFLRFGGITMGESVAMVVLAILLFGNFNNKEG